MLGGSPIGGSSVQSASARGASSWPGSIRESHPSQSPSIARTLDAPGTRWTKLSRTTAAAGPSSSLMLATNSCAIGGKLYRLGGRNGGWHVVRAVVVRAHGGPEVLEFCDQPDPHAGAGEIVIGVRAVSVGRTLDVEARARGADFGAKLPRIPGSDPAGVVLEVGPGVTRFAPGDRVVCTSTLYCGRCEACLAGMTHACDDHR